MDLSENEMTGTIPSEFGEIANLFALVISSTNITGDIPTELGNLTNLNFIIAEDTNVTFSPFMCNLASLSFDESILYCQDYCGTVNEECNGLDLKGKQCEDAACSIGTPTCTSFC